VAEIINVGAEIGLSLNVDKCELIAHDDVVVNEAVLQSFNQVKIEDAILLGAPLFLLVQHSTGRGTNVATTLPEQLAD